MSKKRIISLIVIGVLLSSVSVLATYLIESSDVGYDNSDSELEADNVQDAIDELLEKLDESGSDVSSYEITYNAQNGETNTKGTSGTQTLPVYGDLPTPTKSGNKFLGWYDAATGGNRITSETVIDDDTTIYAHWLSFSEKDDGYLYLDKDWVRENPIYYNPISKSLCNESDAVSTAGTMSNCMKWYAYSEKNGIVNMILDHSIAISVKWYTSANNQYGPVTALASLKNLTDNAGWTTTVQGDYATYTGNVAAQNIDYSGYKARLITAQEVAYIVGNDSWNEKSSSDIFYFDTLNSSYNSNGNAARAKYSWLFENLSNPSYASTNTGYWTSSPRIDTNNAWYVGYSGGLIYVNYVSYAANGIRPVITVQASEIFS